MLLIWLSGWLSKTTLSVLAAAGGGVAAAGVMAALLAATGRCVERMGMAACEAAAEPEAAPERMAEGVLAAEGGADDMSWAAASVARTAARAAAEKRIVNEC